MAAHAACRTLPEIWSLLTEEDAKEPSKKEDAAAQVEMLKLMTEEEPKEPSEKMEAVAEVANTVLRADALEWVPRALQEAELPQLEMEAAPQWDAHLEELPAMPATMTIGHRRRMLGLDTAPASEFMQQHEFISLGCYCAPTFGLQLLDLRKMSYPFDWTRTPLDGIGRCMDAEFQNFLTYRGWCSTNQHPIFLDSEWGGSFWHHDLQNPRTQAVFNRRIERFLGLGDVPYDAPRVFLRLVNHTGELREAQVLRQRLMMALPHAKDILILMLVELQGERGPMVVSLGTMF
ncbi:cyb5r2 [Symbiodinium pilosum]|uniref:Cyb5r2 protein n=1 Tax=Symbiodinium pilosum TaxID=2952 RepID=A0A812YDT8_SYMPI|nr:cyb5r2 [Symbiodinium pilosum]